MKYLIGFVIGLVVSSIGFDGLAHYLHRGVEFIKQTTDQVTK